MARNAIIATTLMLIGAVLFAGPSMVLDAAAEDPAATVTRTGLEAPPACGEELTVTLTIDWENPPEGNHFLSIEETYPAGWTVISSDGNDDGSVLKFWTTNTDRPDFEYTLAVPETVADGTVVSFDGTYFDPAEKTVAGPDTVTVSCGEGGGGGGDGGGGGPAPEGQPSVSRQDPGAQQCGAEFDIVLDLVWEDAGKLFIEEQYPPQWAHGVDNDSISAGGIHNFDENTIKWNLEDWQEIFQVTYSITPGEDDAGTFTFSGEWIDDSGNPSQPIGDTDVPVSCDEPEDESAEVQRSFGTPSPVECGEDLLVQFDITWNDAATLDITDNYPTDWTVHSITSGGTDTGGQVVWEDLTDADGISVSYQVSVPSDLPDGSTESFDGEFQDDIMGAPANIPGDPAEIEIDCPEAGTVARALPAVCTGSFTVTLNVSPEAGSDAWLVIETPPTTNLEVDNTTISNGGVYNASSGEIRWASENGNPATLSYAMNITNGYDDGATWDGEFRISPIMDAREPTEGDTTTTAECAETHAFDEDENCVFDDSELFALIDAWKADDATDDELFSGIAAWKFSPDSYCDK